jgi:methyl-accepting chemotaxis protein
MTDEELRTLVGSLAVATASNTEAIRELRVTMREGFESQSRNIESMREGFESQSRNIESMREGFESQGRNIESMRESMSYNTDAMATALELAAISQRTAAAAQESAAASQVTAAAALELSANTSRNLDRQEQDTAELKQMIGILIRDNQADRVRFSRLEGQN